MFVFDRSAAAVLLPLALLAAVVLWSDFSGKRASAPAGSAHVERTAPEKLAQFAQVREKEG